MKFALTIAALAGLALAVGLGVSQRRPEAATAPASLTAAPTATPVMNDSHPPAPAAASATPADTNALTAAIARETAILAGGCFWGMEEILRKIPGVLETSVGYIGGTTRSPTYREVCTGQTGHAEAVRIVFDPTRISYEDLLGYFFRLHDPTTLNRQHNDIGTQYRSAIFCTTAAQPELAAKVKAKFDQSGRFKRPIVTEITPASEFYPAESYHQKYLIAHPDGYNCHVLTD